jgi:hypothetical protein
MWQRKVLENGYNKNRNKNKDDTYLQTVNTSLERLLIYLRNTEYNNY